MEKRALPTFIVLTEAAKQAERFSGDIPVESLPRLLPHLIHEEVAKSKVYLDLQTGIDEKGRVFFSGTVAAVLPMLCQRCLKSAMIEVDTQFLLTPIAEENEHFEGAYEGFVTDNKHLCLASLVEEEILLNLPYIPKHPEEKCQWPQDEVEGRGQAKTNPFEKLKTLYNK